MKYDGEDKNMSMNYDLKHGNNIYTHCLVLCKRNEVLTLKKTNQFWKVH